MMSTAKADVAHMLNSLPDDSSLEDIQYHLYVLEKIQRSQLRVETEGLLSNDAATSRLGPWLAN
jgi:hypothetical protein